MILSASLWCDNVIILTKIHDVIMDVIAQLYKICTSLMGSHIFFHALTFAGSRGSCLNMLPIGRVLKHLLRDTESVNAMKQTCVIFILAFFTLYQPDLH